MFRLLGWIVFIFVLVIGFRPLKAWYEGSETPHAAVQDIRTDVGQAISPRAQETNGANEQSLQRAPVDGAESQGAAASAPNTNDTESIARDLLQKATRQN